MVYRYQKLLVSILCCMLTTTAIQCSKPKEYSELRAEFDSLYQNQLYEKANQVGLSIISHYQDQQEMTGENGIPFYTIMGLAALYQQHYDEAESYFKRNLDTLRRIDMSRSMLYIDNLSNLSLVYFYTKRYNLAIEVLQQSISIRQTEYPSTISSAAMAIDYLNLGSLHLDYGNADSAYFTLQKAYKLYDSLQIRDKVLSSINFCAQAAIRSKRYTQAADILQHGLRSLHENEIERRVIFLSLLGRTYTLDKKYDDAEKSLMDAHDLSQKYTLPPDLLYQLLRQMADLYSVRGRKELATASYNESLKIAVSLYGEKSRQAGDIFFSYGEHSLRYHDYQTALEAYTNARVAYESAGEISNPFLLNILYRLDSVCVLLGQKDKAEAVKKDIQKIKQIEYGK